MKNDVDVSATEAKSVSQKKWRNRERVMVLCSRGTSFRDRHLMQDLKTLMPHAKGDSKIDKKQNIHMLNEICEMRNCSKCVYFESKKKKDVYLWLSNIPRGPSVKFLVHNVHTLMELKMPGNCLKSSRPVLSFDKAFDSQPFLQLLKELLTQIFGVPCNHPRSQPFIDHVFNFSVFDDKVWFRNYQIVEESGQLEEIGPRFVLEIIKIFEGSFGGPMLYDNPKYTSPNVLRRQMKAALAGKYVSRVQSKKSIGERRTIFKETFKVDPTDDVFETPKIKTEADDGETSKRPLSGKKNKRKRKKQKVVPASSVVLSAA